MQPEGEKQKKRKYAISFQTEWLQNDAFKDWIVKVDDIVARCRYCNAAFPVRQDGVEAIQKHMETEEHIRASEMVKQSAAMTSCFANKNTPEMFSVAAIEVGSMYHAVMHQHSYLSADCGIKLISTMIEDSALVKKLRCGRTKAECIVENVLGPKSIENVVRALGGRSTKKVPYSIATGVSNKGNRKMFPVAVRYFDADLGVQEKLLDFCELPLETAVAISDSLLKIVTDLGLSAENIVAYTADSTAVNYGVRNSVFQILMEQKSSIVKANCFCHILNNAARHGCLKSKYDVEFLVYKIYAELSGSTLENEKLRML
ncbi:uncharacterized protein LOC133382414 [Rhineura floridana]|uniref:uncharacterized protein LOC133382414 n=1 Tax=Rhineura floridana TaxID=261503 RepID=UPI002AC81891|nr:uncharacterized protein LOC133382414 [Rhineura floridana]